MDNELNYVQYLRMRLSTTGNSRFCTPTSFNIETFVLFTVQDTHSIHIQRIIFYLICFSYRLGRTLPRFSSDEPSHYVLLVFYDEFQLHSSRCFLWSFTTSIPSISCTFGECFSGLFTTMIFFFFVLLPNTVVFRSHTQRSISISEVWNSGPINRHSSFPFVGVIVKNL